MSTNTNSANSPIVANSEGIFKTTIVIHENALQFGAINAVMYGQLLQEYTPAFGPDAGKNLAAESWVCLTRTIAKGLPLDYIAVPSPGNTVAPFNTYQGAGSFDIQLPSVQIQAAHVVFLFGDGENVVVNMAGLPQQPDISKDNGVYDFIEFTYNKSNEIYINTSMIDQFGMPVRIQINPPVKSMPLGAGVVMARNDVFTNYVKYMNEDSNRSAFLQCANDAFGNPNSRQIVSPKTAVLEYGVAGVELSLLDKGDNPPPSKLAKGIYYYAVTALNANGVSTHAQSYITSIDVPEKVAVNIAWAGNIAQPIGTASYNVYRGSIENNKIQWLCIAHVDAKNFNAGIAVMDNGQVPIVGQPPLTFNPLATIFDSEIIKLFSTYRSDTPNSKPLQLTATDGTDNGFIYSFSGNTVKTKDGLHDDFISLQLIAVEKDGESVESPPIPLKTAFKVYYPFWNTNTYDINLPSPPSWTVFPKVPASVMVHAAQGVFADNAAQPLPPEVNDEKKYSVLIGAIENQIVAAITRGIANASGNPQNWGNGTAPTQTAPALVNKKSSFPANQELYYLLTATNVNGETYASLEFSIKTNAINQCIQVNWAAMPKTAKTINVYRGESSYGENKLIAQIDNTGSVPVTSYEDDGSVIKEASPPMYFPKGIPSSSYNQFFHLTNVSLNGAAYAGPYDDQGGQSSTLSVANPSHVIIELGTED